MEDKFIQCVGPRRGESCPYDATFTFSTRDQEYYKTQGFEDPKRCRDCRAVKKEGNARMEKERAQDARNKEMSNVDFNHKPIMVVKREVRSYFDISDKELLGEA